MRVMVYRYRNRGQLLPKHQFAQQIGVIGELLFLDELSRFSQRGTRIAKRLDPATREPCDAVPCLYDVVMIAVRDRAMTLSGIEWLQDAMDVREVEYAQSWLVECAER